MPFTQEQKLDQLLNDFAETARARLKKAMASSAVPEQWTRDPDSMLLAKAVLDSVCRDRPFMPLRQHVGDFSNLHMII